MTTEEKQLNRSFDWGFICSTIFNITKIWNKYHVA